MPADRASFQEQFHRRWQHLRDPDVRALAWLIDAPGLLDPAAPQWNAKIASLPDGAGTDAASWLAELDRDPSRLQAYLGVQPFTRLGRYAERLMAFYFEHLSILVANGLQVRANKNDTVGEFDFLLRKDGALVHWEFATKLYLLEAGSTGAEADYFVGPNLADTLGLKMRKILDRQLALGKHPAAQAYLPQPIAAAQALVKGWLFYHEHQAAAARPAGVQPTHCRGFWCALSELDRTGAEHYMILPRLRWLAPARADQAQMVDGATLAGMLSAHFAGDTMPVLIALLRIEEGIGIEFARGFVVPDDWSSRAGDRVHKMQQLGTDGGNLVPPQE
jgi:hypothetical protein